MVNRMELEFRRRDENGDQVHILFGPKAEGGGAAITTFSHLHQLRHNAYLSVCALSEADLISMRDLINLALESE